MGFLPKDARASSNLYEHLTQHIITKTGLVFNKALSFIMKCGTSECHFCKSLNTTLATSTNSATLCCCLPPSSTDQPFFHQFMATKVDWLITGRGLNNDMPTD
ncbi:hypothetical protein AAZX31_09G104300 [Glycine max]